MTSTSVQNFATCGLYCRTTLTSADETLQDLGLLLSLLRAPVSFPISVKQFLLMDLLKVI